jgi:hypothetical protein
MTDENMTVLWRGKIYHLGDLHPTVQRKCLAEIQEEKKQKLERELEEERSALAVRWNKFEQMRKQIFDKLTQEEIDFLSRLYTILC